MIAEMNEYQMAFAINLTAETKEEVVKFARFGISKLRTDVSCSVWFSESGRATLMVSVKKNQKNTSTL